MVIVINIDGEEEVSEDLPEEGKEEKDKRFIPEFHHFPQPQLVPIS